MSALSRTGLEAEECKRSPHYFVFESGLRTKDEHHPTEPIRTMPDLLYLRVLLDCLLVSGRILRPEDARQALDGGVDVAYLAALWTAGILLVEKSRQMLVTWLVCCYLLWRAKYRPHQLLLVQSKKEEDAANLVFVKEPHVARISFMEMHLPRHLKTVSFPRGGAYGRLYFPNGSQIWGIPEGSHIIRSNTPTVVFSDEAAFQPEFGASYTATLPAVKGGGQLVAVSSAEPGEFASLVGEAA